MKPNWNLALSCAIVGAFALTFLSYAPAKAQDFPFVAKDQFPMSFRNKKEFEEYTIAYKAAMCVNSTPGCAIDVTAGTRARNALLFGTLAQIDLNFTKFQRKSRHAKNIFETLMDFLKIGADTAAIITNGERGKNIVTAGSSLVTLLKASTEKNLQLAELNILFNKMEADRAAVLAEIVDKAIGSNQGDASEYPFEIAWLDIIRYYRAGTLDSALAALAGQTGKEKNDNEAGVKTALKNARVQ